MFEGPTKPPMEKRVANTPHVQPGGIAHDLEHVEPSHKHASWFATDPSTLPAPPLRGHYSAREHAFGRQERGLGSHVGSDDLEVTTDAWTTAVYGPQGCDKKPPAVSSLTSSHLGFVDQVKFAPHVHDHHRAQEHWPPDLQDTHALTCAGGGPVIARHGAVLDALFALTGLEFGPVAKGQRGDFSVSVKGPVVKATHDIFFRARSCSGHVTCPVKATGPI